MASVKIDPGLAVRLPTWSHCVVEVKDIGSHSFWGVLRDIKSNQIISFNAVFPIKDAWEVAFEASDIIANL